MKTLFLLMIICAAVGLTVSLVIHILSFFDITIGGSGLFSAMQIGIFPLFMPVIVTAKKISSTCAPKQFWKVMLLGCPKWMRYMTNGIFYYAFVNAIVFGGMAASAQSGGAISAVTWHISSSLWMTFYSIDLAVCTSTYRRGFNNLTLRCPNGHAVGYGDTYCPTCGAPLNVGPGQVAA